MAMITTQRILVVEFDQHDRDRTRGILENEGYEVQAHPDRHQAAAACASFRPHLVLLELDPCEAPDEMDSEPYRNLARARTARVLLQSAADDDLLSSEVARLRVDGYVRKGSPEALRLEVASVLER